MVRAPIFPITLRRKSKNITTYLEFNYIGYINNQWDPRRGMGGQLNFRINGSMGGTMWERRREGMVTLPKLQLHYEKLETNFGFLTFYFIRRH